VIFIPNKKHAFEKRLEVKINKQKNSNLKHPRRHVLLLEFLLPLPIER
jgi:hypothetical protein